MTYISGFLIIKKAFKYNKLYLFNYRMLKAELMKKAKELKIKGRSKMTKEELMKAIMEVEGVEDDGEKKEKEVKGMKQKKIDQMYSKVDTPPAKKVAKKIAKKADPSPRPSPRPSPKMSPKMQEQMKQKMADIQAEKKA